MLIAINQPLFYVTCALDNQWSCRFLGFLVSLDTATYQKAFGKNTQVNSFRPFWRSCFRKSAYLFAER